MTQTPRGKAAAASTAGTRLGQRKAFCKMYYKGSFGQHRKHKVASFNINNFLHENAPEYYLGMCFEGPLLWAFSKAELIDVYRKLKRQEHGTVMHNLTISSDQQGREFGGLHAVVNETSSWLLKDAKQLGL